MLNAARAQEQREEALERLLRGERQQALARVHILRHDQDDDVTPPPADEMDMARSLADVETHAGLIDRAEERLKAVEDALARLATGDYGVCAQCGEELSIARLRAVPLAMYCVECQLKHNQIEHSGAGELSRSFRRHWTVPPELDESFEAGDAAHSPEEEVAVHAHSAFGPEEGEAVSSNFVGGQRGRRGRPPKRKAQQG
jgi:RNA polymerase-binding transcription factor